MATLANIDGAQPGSIAAVAGRLPIVAALYAEAWEAKPVDGFCRTEFMHKAQAKLHGLGRKLTVAEHAEIVWAIERTLPQRCERQSKCKCKR